MAVHFFPRAAGAGAGAVGVSGLGPCWLGPAPPDAPRPPPPPPLEGSGQRYLPRDATRLPRTPVWARPPVPRWARSPSPPPPPPPPRAPTRRRRRLSVWAATAPVRGAASERKHLVLPNFLASVCAPPRRRRRASKAKVKTKEEQKAKQKKRQSPVQSATPRPATRAAAPHAHALAPAHALPLPRPRPRRLRARSSWRDLARLVAAETAALHREDSEERLWRSKGGPWRATVAERAAAAAAAAAQAAGAAAGAGAGGEPEARRPRKSIPLEREEAAESACGASDSPAATLSLLQAVTSTLPALRPRAHLRLALDGSCPPTKTLGLQTCKPFDYLTNKPESMEKLLMDARTVPSKYTYIREKIMGTRNYMKVFFPPEWMHAYCRARRRPMELFPNYAQRTRRARVIGEISLVEFVDKVMAFLQEAEEKERLAESQAGLADTPTRLGHARAGPDDWLCAGDEGEQRDEDDDGDDDDEDLIEADKQ